MTAPAHPSRKSSLRDMVSRMPQVRPQQRRLASAQPTSDYFGINTFGLRQMRAKLPKDVYGKLARRRPPREKARRRDRADGRAGHQGVGDLARRDALHALVPAADRADGREARRLPHRSTTSSQPIEAVLRRAAHPERARCVELPVGRPARHVGSARLHGVEPGEPGVHRRVGRRDARCASRRSSSATTAKRSTR